MICQTTSLERQSGLKRSIYRTKYNSAEKDFKKIRRIANLPIIPTPIIKWELKGNE